MAETIRTGGCMCGAVRYEVAGAPKHIEWCHCDSCRRSSGAPAAPLVVYPAAAARIVRGAPKEHAMSAHGRRLFCGTCGSFLAFANRTPGRESFDPGLGTFDDPGELRCQQHIWTRSRLSWWHVDPRLPERDTE